MIQDKKAAQPIKRYYDVKIEAMIPTTLIYRVLAESPEQAGELYKHQQPIGVKQRLIGKKELKISVYEAGTTMLKFFRNLFR